GVDPATGAIYVCAYPSYTQNADLIKFDGLKGKELYRVKLPRTGQSPNVGEHRIAVDASAKPVKIWLPSLYGSPTRLHCYEDDGEKFVFKGDPRPPGSTKDDSSIEAPRDITVDRVRGEVYIQGNGYRTYRLAEETAEV